MKSESGRERQAGSLDETQRRAFSPAHSHTHTAMRRASLLAHRAVGAARLAPSTSGVGGWVPTDGSGSPGEGRGLSAGFALTAATLPLPGSRLGGAHAGPTFASSSSFATGAAASTGKGSGAAPPPPPPPPQGAAVVDVETVNALFIEAREELEYAAEDAGTTYAGESYEAAEAAVRAAGEAYAAFLAALPDDAARGAVQRGMGMKFEQLRAELEAVDLGH